MNNSGEIMDTAAKEEGARKKANLLDREDEEFGPFESQEGTLILVIWDQIKID